MVDESIRFTKEGVLATISKALYQAVIRVQANEGLEWSSACERAAELIDSGSQEFKRKVVEETRKLHNSELMKQINAARETIREKAFEEGAEYVRMNESHFQVPCSKCGKPMYFSSEYDELWKKESVVLLDAFKDWSHNNC